MSRCHAIGPFCLLTLLAVAGGCAGPVEQVPFAERNVDLEPVRYELDIRLDYEQERLAGTARIGLRNHSDRSIDHVPLLLYRMMRVVSAADADGSPLEHTQGVLAVEDWDRLQVNYVEVRLRSALEPGEQTSVVVEWAGYLFGYVDSGMLYVQERIDPEFTILRPDALAYPEVGYPHWAVNRRAGLPEFEYELRVTVPEDLAVANGGTLRDVTRTDGEATYSYASIKPSWRIDAAIAPYETLERDGLRVFHFAEDAAGAEILAGAFHRAVSTFTEWFGPLPETRGFTIIEIPSGFGSQTDVTCIIQTADAFRDTNRLYELYHEASHLWNVQPTDLPSPRWNEGLAEFLESRLVDLYAGHEELEEVERAAGQNRDSLRERFEQHPELAEVPMVDFGREGMTGYSYRVGMLMFGVLYYRVGPDDFDRIIGEYFRRYHGSGGSTDEFTALASEIAGEDLDPLFRDWLYTTDYRRFLDTELSVSAIADTYRQAHTGSTVPAGS